MGVSKTQSSASNKSKLKSDATALRLELQISPSVLNRLSLSQILMIMAHMINLGEVKWLLVSDLTKWTIFGTWPN